MPYNSLTEQDVAIIDSSTFEQSDGSFEAVISATAKCGLCAGEQTASDRTYQRKPEDGVKHALEKCIGVLHDAGWCVDEHRKLVCRACLSLNWEQALRRSLCVPADAEPEHIAELIKAEGWTPKLIEVVRGEYRWWACPVWRGIFGTVEQDDRTGALMQSCYPSISVALLEGLRKARGIEPLRSI